MRFMVGAFSPPGPAGVEAGQLSGLQPRGAIRLPFDGPPLWAAGYRPGEVAHSPARGGNAEVLAAGTCLATDAELREARDAAERGTWAHATRLPGSYLAVVRHHRTVHIVGDRAGVHVVYWTTDGNHVLWSTSQLALAAYRGAEPDLVPLLTAISVQGVDPLKRASSFLGVHRVPPGSALVLEPGRPPRTEPVPAPSRTATLEQTGELLGPRLTTAVHRRCAGHPGAVSADLSGGIDSSCIASLAAARHPLLAVTYTDAQMADQDDVRYARAVAAEYPSITHLEINGSREKVRHFDGLTDPATLPLTDSPSLSVGLLAIKRAQLAPARAHNAGLHLTGRGGDNCLDSIPLTAVDRLRTSDKVRAVQQLAAFARARRAPLHSCLAQAAVTARTPQPRALQRLAARLRRTGSRSGAAFLQPAQLLAWCGTLPAADWLAPGGRRLVADLIDARAATADPDALPGATHERLALERMAEEQATYDQITRQLWKLPMHAPYLDTPVVDACLAVPGWERWAPGDFKPLARHALTGAVPGHLLTRRTKTAMTASLHLGVRANHATLNAVITGSRLAAAGLIDPTPALAALAAAARGETAPLGSLHYLIAAELWLTTLTISREHWWQPAAETTEIPA
ncbi:asparagine synthase-related protein [Streptomyces sp. 5K101]|uniref:asparagine synthase-related protein n=1 Tax=Streptomyces sp. 5K101 TaxID=3390037 RepID=UPI003975CC27